MTPFTGPDLKMLTDAVGVMNKYLSPVEVGLVDRSLYPGADLSGLDVPQAGKFEGKIRYWVNIPLIAAGVAVFAGTTKLALDHRVLSNYFGNIAYAMKITDTPTVWPPRFLIRVSASPTGIRKS